MPGSPRSIHKGPLVADQAPKATKVDVLQVRAACRSNAQGLLELLRPVPLDVELSLQVGNPESLGFQLLLQIGNLLLLLAQQLELAVIVAFALAAALASIRGAALDATVTATGLAVAARLCPHPEQRG
jgi:hypothetical protein